MERKPPAGLRCAAHGRREHTGRGRGTGRHTRRGRQLGGGPSCGGGRVGHARSLTVPHGRLACEHGAETEVGGGLRWVPAGWAGPRRGRTASGCVYFGPDCKGVAPRGEGRRVERVAAVRWAVRAMGALCRTTRSLRFGSRGAPWASPPAPRSWRRRPSS